MKNRAHCSSLQSIVNAECYGKYWFKYKQQSSFLPGPEILFELAKDCQMVDSLFKDRGIWTAVEAVLQRNAFCC